MHVNGFEVIDVFEESFAYADYLMILDNVIEYIEMLYAVLYSIM